MNVRGKKRIRRLPWFLLHWVIIVNFIVEIFYGFYQIFFVLIPPGGKVGPLMGAASEISFELLVTRRLYAAETWIAIAGLAIYLAIIYRDKFRGFFETGRAKDDTENAVVTSD